LAAALILGGLLVLLLIGAPVFAALGLMSLIVIVLSEGQLNAVADTIFAKLNNGHLAVIPMFAFMAQVMIRSKVVDHLYDAANTMMRHIQGGLGVATVLACAVFSSISGSSVATALTIGTSALPHMKRFGYRDRDSYGVIAAGGTLGVLIPPSVPLILYAIVTETSIGMLFLAAMLPGLLMTLIFALFCVMSATIRPVHKPASWVGWSQLRSAVRQAFWALMMPPIVLGGIYFGVFTVTEAAVVGCLYALLVGAGIYRNFGFRDLWQTAYETVRSSAMILMILASAAIFAYAVTLVRLPVEIVEAVVSLDMSAMAFVLAVMAAIFVLGMFLETIAIILITTPIVFPVILELGIDPIWYGILLVINLELALITPPVGMNLFVIKGIAKAPMADIIAGTAPYFALMLFVLAVVLTFPSVATWLPKVAGYG